MTYWATGVGNLSPSILLANADGRCGDWAAFFIDCLRVHGITSAVLRDCDAPAIKVRNNLSSDVAAARPLHEVDFSQSRNILFVKSWAPKPRALSPSNKNKSSKAQGDVPDPQGWFEDHALVEWNGKVYDPSYGGPIHNSVPDWENYALEGFGSNAVIGIPGLLFGPVLWLERPPTPNQQMTTLGSTTY